MLDEKTGSDIPQMNEEFKSMSYLISLELVWAIIQYGEWLRQTALLTSLSPVGMPRMRKGSPLRPFPAWQRQRRMRHSCQCSVLNDPGWPGQHGGQQAHACVHSP